jgi:CrcB protein
LVLVGGALGSLLRYIVAVAMTPVSVRMPLGTLLINVTGSFVIGFFDAVTLSHGRYPVPEAARLFVMVGFCGGFTTFSSFSLQTLDLLRAGAVGRALLNVLASVVLCVLAVFLGHVLASGLNGGAKAVAQIVSEEEA